MWKAKYFDGTELDQFSNGKENLFKDIKLKELRSFELRVNSKIYEVDLVDGSFTLDGAKLRFENFGEQNDFELIYFRRVKKPLGPHGVFSELYCFGWKTNIDGHSFKRIIKIGEGSMEMALK